MANTEEAIRPGAAEATDQYGRVFVLLLAIVWFTMFLDDSRLARVVVGMAVIAVVMFTLRATGVTNRILRIASIIAAGFGIVVATSGFTDAKGIAAVVSVGAAAVMVVGILALTRRIFEQPRVRFSEIVAALSAYLQIALAFSFLFAGASRLTDGDFFKGGIEGQASDFFYFSFVTITTLGYGDLSPATATGRSLAMTEALLGQIFLIVLVAYLVGRLGQPQSIVDRET